MLCVRKWISRRGRVAPLVLPLWPMVAVALAVWGVVFCAGAEAVPPIDWVGQSREAVVAGLGKPSSALQRGDTEVLMYPKNVRVEIRDGEVVSFRSGHQAVLVKGDGTRYTPSERGKVTRIDTPPEEEAIDDSEPTSAVVPVAPPRPEAASPSVAKSPSGSPAPASVSTPMPANEDAADEDESWMQEGSDSDAALVDLAENYGETDMFDKDKADPPPPWVNAVMTLVLGLFRFGFAVVVLRLAISFVDLPCYMPDVLKVAALFVVIREAVHGLGGLGGHWEWLRLFRAADVIGFLSLCGLLVKFKVATQGITALKIAIATIVASYLMMLLIGLALVFGFGAMF